MADNIFSKSPVKIAQESARARSLGILENSPSAPTTAPSGPADFDSLARRYQVPANVIEAAFEMSGADQKTGADFAAKFSEAVGSHIASGKDVKNAVIATMGEHTDAAEALLQLASDKVKAADGAAPSVDGDGAGKSLLGSFGDAVKRRMTSPTGMGSDIDRRLVSTLANTIGGTIEGVGRGIDEIVNPKNGLEFGTETGPNGEPLPKITEGKTEPGPATKAGRAIGNFVRAGGDLSAEGISEEANQKMQDAMPGGDFFKPSTWTAPKDFSAEGAAHLAVEVMGSLAPVVITGLLTRSPGATMAAGGAQSAGFAADQARETIDAAAKDVGEDGVSRLEKESPYYRSLIAGGETPEDAVALTSEAAQRSAANLAAIPGAIGGAITGRLLQAPLKALASRGAATRVGGSAAAGGIEEGLQEVSETVATRQGINDATGMNLDLTEDTAADFALGAVGGGPVGAIGGVRQDKGARLSRELDRAVDAAPEAVAPEPMTDANNTMWLDADGRETTAPEPVEPPARPTGPMARAAAIAPVMTPEPEPLAGNSPAGSKVRITIPGGKPFEATFQEETPEGITFDADGSPFFIPRDQIEAGEVAVDPIDPLSQARADADGPTMPPIPDTSPYSDQVRFDVATEVDHAIYRAQKSGNTSGIGGISVDTDAESEALRQGANAALAGAEVPPTYNNDDLSNAAQVGFDMARNKAETALIAPPQGVPGASGPVRVVAASRKQPPTLQKRPFTAIIKGSTGGIDPQGEAAEELKHRGITSKTAPGLFRKGGVKELDNLPASEYAEYAEIVGQDGNGYLSRNGIIEALVAEAAGNPVQGREQMELQAEADARAELEELRELGIELDEGGQETVTPEQSRDENIIPPRGIFDDFDLDQTRTEEIYSGIRQVESDLGVQLTAAERQSAFDHLNENGGSVEDAIWWRLEREAEQYAETNDQSAVQDPGPPLFESEVSGQGGREGDRTDGGDPERPTGNAAGETGGTPEADASESIAEPSPKPERPTGIAPDRAKSPKAPAPKAFWNKASGETRRMMLSEIGLPGGLAASAWSELEQGKKRQLSRLFRSNVDAWTRFDEGEKAKAEQQDEPQNIQTPIQEPEIEVTPEGEQTLIPGVTPVTDKERAETQAAKPKRGGDAPADFGLFDSGARNQQDLFAGQPSREPSPTPSNEDIDAAAAEANPSPTPAQAEAGNYKKGRFKWNGLDLVIETAKGEERRGTAQDGTEWSVTMPAHYGDVKRTEGADGDPVDFYMGDVPGSDYVVIVNQVDPDTQEFDEHKVVLGTITRGAALDLYRRGFSDGSGNDRIGSVTLTTVDGFKSWLENGDLTGPTEPITMEYTKRKPKKAKTAKPNKITKQGLSGLTDEENAELASLEAEMAAIMKGQLNSGLDPKLVEIGYKMGRLYVRAGRRQFTDFITSLMERVGLTFEQAQPVARNAYNQIRDDMDLDGEDVSDMQTSQEVMQIVRDMRDKPGAAPDATEPKNSDDLSTEAEAEVQTALKSDREKITDVFLDAFRSGEAFKTITQARKRASEAIGRDLIEDDLKVVEEAIEAAIVLRSREIISDARMKRKEGGPRNMIGQGPTNAEVYDELTSLYASQPKLAQRTSTSMEQQAYSTPAPLAFLASRLAGIKEGTTIFEPSAGNGMLMIGATDENIIANELNPDRFEQLSRIYPGAEITQGDAMADENQPRTRNRDVVIANPPFGKVKDADRNNVRFEIGDVTTTEIDHAIAWRALEAMKNDGKSVLIIGGHQGDADTRKEKYRQTPRKFMKRLYDTYNVTEHFTVDGKLYERQGAGWPVDVIVIEGRNPSKKVYPMKEAPILYSSWDELRSRLDGTQDSLDPRGERELPGDGAGSNVAGNADTGAVSRPSARPSGSSGEGGNSGGSRSGGNGGTPDVGVGPADPGSEPVKSGASSGSGERDTAQQDDGQSNLPDEGSEDGAGQGSSGGNQRRDPDGLSERPLPVKSSRKKPARENTESETAFQVQYAPRSGARFAVGTLVPRNMQDAATAALDALEARVGDIDEYVAGKLGMTTDEMLGTDSRQGAFSAEQVDALALSIANIEDGKGFIIGDQTGVGKGRINAGLIRYAMRAGKTPVFFTVKPGLYGDMIRDLRDIGEESPEDYVYITNDGLRGGKSIPLSDDPADRLTSMVKSQNQKAIDDIRSDGSLPAGKKVIFTTYDQMNTVKKSVTPRMQAISAIAPNAMFIMDESHEAGGTGRVQVKPGDPEPRSAFIRGLLRASDNGAFFSSATFAKNPAVMSLYFKTNISEAVPDIDRLESVVEAGGVPLQQIISNNLVKDGQYLRRERTYEGIEMNLEQLPTDPSLGSESAMALREVFLLDQNVMTDVRDAFSEEVAAEMGGATGADNSIGDAGASSTNFSSVMHNAVNQVLLAIKARSVADAAIEAFKRGEKPIIALSNTNASIMEDYAEESGISIGDAFDIPFNEILRRYIQRLRRITIKNDDDTKTHVVMSDNDIARLGGQFALDEVRRVERIVDQIDFGGMPASPIDFLREELEKAGVRTGEVTGRGKLIEGGIYQTRDNGAAANKRAMNEYNAGKIDALIINRSGATGFSLHATKDNDGKVRHMFILQPDPNIDTFMQMLGRINRTGQIKLPKYTIAVSDLAVEKRPAAVLMRKMASLNANTTASKTSAVSLDNVTDFMNKYGDDVVVDYLRENPELAAMTGIGIPKKKSEAAGIAAKFTGKLAILEPDEVSRIFDDIEAMYKSYIEELDSLGQNSLEAKTLPLDARTTDRTVISEGTNPESAFGSDTVLENVDVKVIGKPYTLAQLDEQIEKVLGGKSDHDFVKDQAAQIDADAPAARAKLEERRPKLEARAAEAKTVKQQDAAQDAIRRLDASLAAFDRKVDEVKNLIHNFRPSRPVMVNVVDRTGQTVDSVYGITLGVDLSKINGNLNAMSRAGVRVAIASPARELRVPANRFLGDDTQYELMNARDETVRRAFESGQADAREDRQIVTGNIISGLEKFGRGQIVMFTREDGGQDQGILLPKDFNARQALEERPVIFETVDQAIQFADTAGTGNAPGLLKSEDGVLTAQRTYGGYQIKIQRKGHQPYTLNPSVREIVGDFTGRSGPFRKDVRGDQLRSVLEIYRDTLGTKYLTEAHKDQARMITGETLPDFGEDQEMSAPLGWDEAEPNRIPEDQIAGIATEVQAEIEASNLGGKVTARVVRKINRVSGKLTVGDGPQGIYRTGRGQIEVNADAGAGPIGVLRHEIIHALRDSAFWGKPYGLFTKGEWRALVAAAKRDRSTMIELRKIYPNLTEASLTEEAVAEMYRRWRHGENAGAQTETVLGKIKSFFEAMANAMLGRGFNSSARIMQAIADGDIGGRGDPDPNGPGGIRTTDREMRVPKLNNIPKVSAKSAGQFVSDTLTQAMNGSGGTNLLALVPGRALLSELGKDIPAAGTYLTLKEKMDALRNQKHADTDELAQKWRKMLNGNKEANISLMDLMHDSTIEGQDPSGPFLPVAEPRDPELLRKYGPKSKTGAAAKERIEADKARKPIYDDLRARFDKLPKPFRSMYVEVRDAYSDLSSEFEKAIEENAARAMSVAVRRAERAHKRRIDEIRDDGLTGKEYDEAIADADAELKTAKMKSNWSKQARLQTLRMRFEHNRLNGPYFPLARFGDFYVTLRNDEGKVVSFSKFEKARHQRQFAKEQEAAGYKVETGVMKDMQARSAVDPGFVADVEGLLEEIDADSQVMDAIWQRWLQTLPDMSTRKSKIHRKGTPGYTGDAFRAFGSHMFHGAHQLARLKYSLEMGEALDVAEEEARHSVNPERNGLVVKEMAKRHEYIMNPKGAAWAQYATSAAFIYYLSMTPAAALVNLTQTSVVGVPVLGAFHGKGGQIVAAKELSKALSDFGRGKGHTEKSARLTSDERNAMKAAYDRGTIDKSQSHDLAGVGETGVEYNAARTKAMAFISWGFHHAERLNREVTFLAAYRMARKKGLDHEAAITKGADLTWKTHFDYQNTSRPRLMQNDAARVALVFRNFSINMLWRLFRDTHQAVKGEDTEVKSEARRQLVGISAQMLLNAGVKGVWGYSLIMGLAGLFFGGGSDEAEKEMEKALLSLLPRDMVGMMLNGVPGHLLGIDLRARVGMPDLWFRSPDRELEGEDEYNYWMQQFLGAVPGMAQNIHRGVSQIAEGNVYRGTETILPKFLRDVMRSGRYLYDGAQTYNGDPIIDDFKASEVLSQFIGFTPARLSERYDANRRLKNEEVRIIDDRRRIMKEAGIAALDGKGIPEPVVRKIEAFNKKNPDYPITNKSLRQSIAGRARASARNEFGIQLNPRLNDRLRKDAAPLIYE